jgi:hypothetical protein
MTRRPLRVAFGALCALATVLLAASDAHEAPAPQKRPAPVDDGGIKLTERQIAAGNFAIREVTGGILSKRIAVPGTIVPSGERIARFPSGCSALSRRYASVWAIPSMKAKFWRSSKAARSPMPKASISPRALPLICRKRCSTVQRAFSDQGQQRERLSPRADRVRGHPHQVRCRATEALHSA